MLNKLIPKMRRILALIKKEFIMTWLDPKSRGIIIIMPLVQLFMFSQTVTLEVKNIDMAVLDMDRTVESRELISGFSASTHFRSIIYFDDAVSFRKRIDFQSVQLGLEINEGFGSKILAHQPTEVLIIADGRSTNTATLASNYATQIVSNYSKLVTPKQISKIKNPSINITGANWFNPNLEFKWFILPIIICNLSVIIVLILTSLSIARERELGTFDQLVVSPLSATEILIGKTIPPLSISLGITVIMVGAVILLYGIPFLGGMWLLLISTCIAMLALVGVGLFISSICKTQQQAALSVITFMYPMVLTSGFISPIEDMPPFFQYLTILNPIRWYITNNRAIFLKDIPIETIFIHCIPLTVIATITLSLAAWTFKRKTE